jgi:colicin import membrane protein
MKFCAVLLVVALSGLSAASFAASDAEERARIASERNEANATFARQQRECQQRFVVTSCVEAARAEQRGTLARLRREQSVLDEAQRRQRAAGRVAAIREKVRAEEARAAQPPRPPREPAIRAVAPRAQPVVRAASAPVTDENQRRAEEARRRAAYEKRQHDARVHREVVERRAAEARSKTKVPVTPLPVPPAGSAPR